MNFHAFVAMPFGTKPGADGAALPSTSTLGCFDTQGFARCAWITPRVTLPAGDYALRLAPLLARNDVRCEAAPLRLAVRGEEVTPARFVTPLPYAVIPWLIVRHEREVTAAAGSGEAPTREA